MNLIEMIINGQLTEAKELIKEKLDSIRLQRLEEVKKYIAADIYEEELYESVPVSTNVVKMGRIQKIRRRIRRSSKGRIVVQRNRRRSAIKGYRVVGHAGTRLKRITAVQRINKARKLKRYWKSKGRAKLQRVLMKRRISMHRRQSMGIR